MSILLESVAKGRQDTRGFIYISFGLIKDTKFFVNRNKND